MQLQETFTKRSWWQSLLGYSRAGNRRGWRMKNMDCSLPAFPRRLEGASATQKLYKYSLSLNIAWEEFVHARHSTKHENQIAQHSSNSVEQSAINSRLTRRGLWERSALTLLDFFVPSVIDYISESWHVEVVYLQQCDGMLPHTSMMDEYLCCPFAHLVFCCNH